MKIKALYRIVKNSLDFELRILVTGAGLRAFCFLPFKILGYYRWNYLWLSIWNIFVSSINCFAWSSRLARMILCIQCPTRRDDPTSYISYISYIGYTSYMICIGYKSYITYIRLMHSDNRIDYHARLMPISRLMKK